MGRKIKEMKKLYYFFFLLFSLFLLSQIIFYNVNGGGNLSIRFTNCNPNDTMMINNMVLADIDTVKFESYYTIWESTYTQSLIYSLPIGNYNLILVDDSELEKPFLDLDFNLFLVTSIEIIYEEDGSYSYKYVNFITNPRGPIDKGFKKY